jgi:parallel beta-helix repeat protein
LGKFTCCNGVFAAPAAITLWERNIMNRIAAVIAGLSLAFVGTSASISATINVPGDYTLIQDAINASSDGDTIAIAAGTYDEHSINTNNKAITIGSASGNLDVTIDAQQGGSVFVINSGEGSGTEIKDLVITGGNATQGGGIYCRSSNPTISGCTIEGNTGSQGGGIYCYNYSDPIISGCTISDNTANEGGGIYCNSNSSPTISNCTITGNTAAARGGGISCLINSSPAISDCTISDNTANEGGGISFISSNPTISNCTISGNTAYVGGGIYSLNSNFTIGGGSVCDNSADQTFADSYSNIESSLCWIAASCDGNPYDIINNQQEQINQLLTMHDQQQSAIEDLQQVVEACCAEKSCASDENQDGKVDIFDLLLVIENWGSCP